MEHTEALNLLLANACVTERRGDVYIFVLDLHCAVATVEATLLSTYGSIQYTILSIKIA